MTSRARWLVPVWILTLLSLALVTPTAAQDRPQGASRAPAISAADEATVRSFIEKYYQAYAAKDLQTVLAAWNPASPDAQTTRNILPAMFDIQDHAFSNLRVGWIRPAATGVVVRVIVDVAIRSASARQGDGGQWVLDPRTRTQHWVRNVSLRLNGSDWSIWRDASASDEVVAEVVKLPTADEQFARIAAEPDIDVKLIRDGLEREATRAFTTNAAKKALALHQLCRTLAERAGDADLVALSEINIAFVYQSSQDHRNALEWFEKASAGFLAAGKRDRQAATEMNIGAELYSMGELAAAQEHYETALAVFTGIGEPGWLPTIHHNLGNIGYLQGNWDIALEHYKKSAALQEADAQPATSGTAMRARGIASAYEAMGLVFKEQGDYASAHTAFDKSLARYKAAGDETGKVRVREETGLVYRLEGDYALSLKEYLTAWNAAAALPLLSPEDPLIGTKANLLAEIGDVYALEQRYVTALDYLEKSLVLQEQAKSVEGRAAVLGGIGGMHFLLGHFDPALDNYRKALVLREALGQKRSAARLLAHIGLVLAAQEKPVDALASYEKSLETAEADADDAGTAIALVLIASSHAEAQRYDQALGLATRGADLAAHIDDLDVLAHARLVAGDALQHSGNLDGAHQAIAEAIDVVERLRATDVSSETRFFDDTVVPYTAMAHLLLAQGHEEEAFGYAERSRLVRVQEILGGGAAVVKGLSPEEREWEQQLRRRTVSLRTQARKAADQPQPDQARLAALSHDLDEAIVARAAFENHLYEQHPELRVLRAKNDPAPLSDAIAQVVDSRTALLEFSVTESRTCLFLLTRPAVAVPPSAKTGRGLAPETASGPTGVRVYTIDVKATDLAKRIGQLRDAIARHDPAYAGIARDLHTLLLEPAAAQLAGKKRLLIVPDSVLWALPFQALQSADGRYVIEDRAVAYAPSLTALVAMTAGEGNRTTAASPALRLLTLALAETGKDAVDRLALVRPDLKVQPLPEAEREARALSLLFVPTRTRAYVGREATVDRLAADAPRAAVIHVGVRGLLNDASPLHSLVALSPAPNRPGDDGIIEAADAMGWKTAARTVVFSRLYADSGLTQVGGGAVGLAWACFVGGAPTTVMSEWVVDAPSTTLLVQAFHRGLRGSGAAGQQPPRPSEALRLATLPLLQGKTRDPFYWAGFIVIGDAR
jgi:CHAT domain-containing protein/predicted negative regulator of RcsB-dependent stress response